MKFFKDERGHSGFITFVKKQKNLTTFRLTTLSTGLLLSQQTGSISHLTCCHHLLNHPSMYSKSLLFIFLVCQNTLGKFSMWTSARHISMLCTQFFGTSTLMPITSYGLITNVIFCFHSCVCQFFSSHAS